MTAWVDMNRREKEAAVQPLLVKGLTYSEIAEQLGATSRNAIGTIATSLREKGALSLKPRTSSPEPKAAREKRAAKTPAKVAPKTPKRDKVLRKSAAGSVEVAPMRGPNNPHPFDFKARAEQRASSPGLAPALIAGVPIRPVDDLVGPLSKRLALVDLTSTTCRWPTGDPRAEDFGFCGHDVSDAPYCAYHKRLAHEPPTTRQRAEIRSAERKFA